MIMSVFLTTEVCLFQVVSICIQGQLSWLAILRNERVDFSIIDVLFGKFDTVEEFIVINNILFLAKFSIGLSSITQTIFRRF